MLALWSERPDLNRRPLAPKASALPGCATLRRNLTGLNYYMYFHTARQDMQKRFFARIYCAQRKGLCYMGEGAGMADLKGKPPCHQTKIAAIIAAVSALSQTAPRISPVMPPICLRLRQQTTPAAAMAAAIITPAELSLA